jgi:hypothetical protein
MQRVRYWIAGLTVIALIAIIAIYWSRQRRSHSPQPQEVAYGQFTSVQITERTLALCSLIDPQTPSWQIHPDRLTTQTLQQPWGRIWCVDCSSQTEERHLLVLWNADTGELLCIAPHTVGEEATPVSSPRKGTQELKQIAWQWLVDLGYGRKGENWRLVCTEEGRQNKLMMHWRSPHRQVYVIVNTSTGQLAAVSCSLTSQSQVPGL